MTALVLLAAASVVLSPLPTPFSDARPPAVFQHDNTVTLDFASQARINARCQSMFGAPPAGMRTNACANGRRLIMPNPCAFPDSDPYAHLLCHELGHANGWSPNHGDAGEAKAGAPEPEGTSGKTPT